MTVNSQRLLLAAAGAGGAAGEGLYVDEVFSTFVYPGDSSAQTITNGIDLDGEGGLVWIKRRDGSDPYILQDTERGTGKFLRSNSSAAESNAGTARVSAFNSDGFSVGTDSQVNFSSQTYVSWTFRKAPGFFDVVTYTGNGTAGHTISHSLGSVPGAIFVKRRDTSDDWAVWHRSLGATKYLQLNLADAAADLNTIWNDTEPTSTNFTVGVNGKTNTNGSTYVAYIFAHDDQSFGTDSDEAIIKCDSYTGNGSSTGPVINLGFEPQWLLIKGSSVSSHWVLFDIMRGIATTGDDAFLSPNNENQLEETVSNWLDVNATGFQLKNTFGNSNSNNQTYTYIAIRRPHKPPEAATDVFKTVAGTYSAGSSISQDFPIDLVFGADRSNATAYLFEDRLRFFSQSNGNAKVLKSHLNNAETTSGNPIVYEVTNDNLKVGYALSGYSATFNFFRRAAGFFDIVCWTGTSTSGSSSRALNHNLAATPELMIGKRRGSAGNWSVFTTTTGINNELELNKDAAVAGATNMWNGTPTDTTFTVGYALDGNSNTHVAYLFASLAGVSKVGSYSGTGSNVGVDCGFTAGARFVLIKRTDSTGDWYVYDSARGIVGGNDPYKLTNSSAAEVTNTDYIDPLNSGFTVTSSAPADLNASGGTYIFLAIA